MSESASNQPKTTQINIPRTFQRVLSRTIPGPTSPQNKFSLDWGWQGFIAYGAQNSVIVVDPVTLQVAQTLCQHRSHVVQVRWHKTSHYHHSGAPYSLVLASSDAAGCILIWNVLQGETYASLQDGSKPVTEIEWLGKRDGSEHLLAALHPPYSFILWDTRHSSKIWKKSYTEILCSFQFDPFHNNKLAFLCNGCILFVDDFNTNKCPSSNGKRFFLSSPTSPSRPNSVSTPEDKEKFASSTLKRKVKKLVTGEVKSKTDDPCQISECIQLLYHHSTHDLLILVYPREILLIDLDINQTVGIVPIDRGAPPIMQVISCWQRDVLFCLHESGSIAGYFRRPYHMKEEKSHLETDPIVELLYERKCCSEPLRLSKSNRPIGFGHNPVSEKSIALALGDGRFIFKELIPQTQPSVDGSWMDKNLSQLEGSSSNSPSFQKILNTDMNIKDNYFTQESLTATSKNVPNLSLTQSVKPPFLNSEESVGAKINGNLRLMMVGLMPSLSPPPLVIRMCPPLTTKNINEYTPLLAVGTQTGSIQVINLATGMIEREFSLHTYPVKGIEWTSLTSFLSFANQPLTNAHGLVRNELIHSDVRTGYSITLRIHETEESPIELIKISYLKQYFIIILKDDPFELWDCQKLIPLRTMSRRFPKVTAFEWSPTTHVKARKESLTSPDPKKENEGIADDTCSISSSLSSLSLQSVSEETALIKETMVFTDTEGQLYHFSVKGNVIKHVTKTPPDTQRNAITCIAFKSNEIVLSDSDGVMTVWDLKSRVFRNVNTHRGYIKKMRYAPGKDNMKLLVLYNDGVDIWDIREVVLISQLKCPKDIAKILDIDWGASDCPILATVDGCLRVMDIHLKKCSSPMNQYYTKEPIISPYLLSGEAALNLRTLITHQHWKERYSLCFTTEDGFTPSQLSDINLWLSRIPDEVKDYLESCDSVAHRALVAAHLFGDEGEILFWSVATHYLIHMWRHPSSIEKQDKLIDIPSEQTETTTTAAVSSPDTLLDLSFYHLCDNFIYKKHELERLFLQEAKDLTGVLRDNLGRKLGVIGERDRVVRLLLDEDSSEPHFYTDCLRACLLSATHHSTQAQSTIKLVATNLIAAGNIWEGIELLCIIGKALDACRYLQSYGYWDDSIWLAKCVLSHKEASDIYKRWSVHLSNSGNKDMAVCTYLAGGMISSALNQLVQQQYHQRAALLLDAAQQFMLPVSGTTSNDGSSNSPVPSSGGLFENIFKKYTYYLFGLGNQSAAIHFCEKIGGKEGEALKKEFMMQKG